MASKSRFQERLDGCSNNSNDYLVQRRRERIARRIHVMVADTEPGAKSPDVPSYRGCS